MDRIISMRVFVHAAADGSLAAAARHLGTSPAMAVKHVNALEARLCVKLFHRTTRRLSLTEAGSNYLEACQRIRRHPEVKVEWGLIAGSWDLAIRIGWLGDSPLQTRRAMMLQRRPRNAAGG